MAKDKPETSVLTTVDAAPTKQPGQSQVETATGEINLSAEEKAAIRKAHLDSVVEGCWLVSGPSVKNMPVIADSADEAVELVVLYTGSDHPQSFKASACKRRAAPKRGDIVLRGTVGPDGKKNGYQRGVL